MSKKRKFVVKAVVTVSVETEVLAETKEAALEEALGRPMQSLCHQCSSGDHERDEAWVLGGELDGEPVIEDKDKAVQEK